MTQEGNREDNEIEVESRSEVSSDSEEASADLAEDGDNVVDPIGQSMGSKRLYEMRKCYWEAIDCSHGTVFDEGVYNELSSGDHSGFKVSLGSEFFSSLRKTFTKEIVVRELSEAERIGQAVGAIGGKLGKGTLTFLDQRRFNNVAIKLRQMNKTNQFIRRAVLSLDEDFFTLERVNALLQCAPTGDDLESIAPYNGDPDLLALCERFFYDVQDVPLFTRRIQAIQLKLEFNEEIEDLLSDITTFSAAVLSVAQSKALIAFINVVLQVGNFLNESSSKKRVTGFDIAFLPKISYIKSGDLKTTLMRFVLDYLDSSPAHVGLVDQLIADLTPCILASRISLHRLEATIGNLKKKLNSIKLTKTAIFNRNKKTKLEGDVFEEKMTDFLDNSFSLINKFLEPQVKAIHDISVTILRFYGVTVEGDNSTSKGESFFSIFMELVANISVSRRLSEIEAEKRHIRQLKREALQNAANAKQTARDKRREKINTASLNIETQRNRQHEVKLTSRITSNVEKVPENTEDSFENQVAAVRERMKTRRMHPETRNVSDIEPIFAPGVPINPAMILSRRNRETSGGFLSPDFVAEETVYGDICASKTCVEIWHQINSGGYVNWMAMSLSHISRRLELLASGSGGMHEMVSEESVTNPTVTAVPWTHDGNAVASQAAMKPFVACFRVVGIDESSRRHKFVAVYFNHADLSLRIRSELSQLRRHVQSFLTGTHVEFMVESSLADITERSVSRKILSSGGAHAPKRFEF